MSTFILEVQFIDAINSIDKEFDSLSAVQIYLIGHRETDFDWLSLHDNNTDMVIEGWSDIHQYINENTGEPKHDLSECSPACNCMYCRLSQDSSIAFTGSAIPVKPDTTEYASVPRVERFSDLPDGAYFMCVGPHTSTRIFQKVMEDGEHNAVWADHTHIGELIPHSMPVIQVEKSK